MVLLILLGHDDDDFNTDLVLLVSADGDSVRCALAEP